MTRAQLITKIDTYIYENSFEEITAQFVNELFKDICNSFFSLADDSTAKPKLNNAGIAALNKTINDNGFEVHNTDIKCDMIWDGSFWCIKGNPELTKAQADALITIFSGKMRYTFFVLSNEDNAPFTTGGLFAWAKDNAGNYAWKQLI